MTKERTLYRVTAPVLTIDGQTVGHGDTIWSDEAHEDYNWDILVSRDDLVPVRSEVVSEEPGVEPELGEADGEEGDESEDLSVLTRGALLDRLGEGADISEDDIAGTGSDGYVTKQDALEVAREYL